MAKIIKGKPKKFKHGYYKGYSISYKRDSDGTVSGYVIGHPGISIPKGKSKKYVEKEAKKAINKARKK